MLKKNIGKTRWKTEVFISTNNLQPSQMIPKHGTSKKAAQDTVDHPDSSRIWCTAAAAMAGASWSGEQSSVAHGFFLGFAVIDVCSKGWDEHPWKNCLHLIFQCTCFAFLYFLGEMLVWLNFVGYGLQAVRNTIPPCIVSKAGSFQATEFHKKKHIVRWEKLLLVLSIH